MITCYNREHSCLHLRAEWVLPLERKKVISVPFLPSTALSKQNKTLKKPEETKQASQNLHHQAKANSNSVRQKKGSSFGLEKTFAHTGLDPPCLSDLTTKEPCTRASGSSPEGWNSVSIPDKDEFPFPFLAVLQLSKLSSLGLRGVF